MSLLFKGERTPLFWAGLLILCFTFVVLFSAIWNIQNYSDTIIDFESGSETPVLVQAGLSFDLYIQIILPWIVGGIFFILIGLYTMKSGVKKEQPPTQN